MRNLFQLRRQSLSIDERRAYRLIEMIPGVAVWVTFVVAITIALVKPLWAIPFIIVYDAYWLIRVMYVMTHLILAFRRFRAAEKIPWRHRLEQHQNWQRILHVIMLPVSNESLAVIRSTFESLQRVDYPLDRLVIVLAIEERFATKNRPLADLMVQQFGQVFHKLLVVEHPANIPGELAGKGANIAWAGRELQRYIDAEHIPYADVLISTFDADSIAHPLYFAYLTDTFLNTPDRLHASYQPIPLFHNNAWDALPITRVVANSTTFWLLSETMRPDRLFTFSSHSMPFQALVDVDFWQNDIVTEDSRIFLQCFIRYDGRYTVVPMYIPISMDTVSSVNIWRSMINQYKQIRRWAYGVENFPFMVWNFSKNRAIPASKKIRYVWNQFEGVYSWATGLIVITLMGWIPFHVQPERLNGSVLAANAPGILQGLMALSIFGLVISAVLNTIMVPSRPKNHPAWQWLIMVFQWLLLPITLIIFGSIPAIDAQTRLMFGRYLGFWVTEKERRS